MAASLHAIQELATMDAQPFRNLIPSLLNILKQVRVVWCLCAACAEHLLLSCSRFADYC